MNVGVKVQVICKSVDDSHLQNYQQQLSDRISGRLVGTYPLLQNQQCSAPRALTPVQQMVTI